MFGVDEAGVGAIVGPLIIVCVTDVEPPLPKRLNRASQLDIETRNQVIVTLHEQSVEYEVVEVTAQEIDAARRAGQANDPYFDAVAETVTKATSKGEHGIIDAFSDWSLCEQEVNTRLTGDRQIRARQRADVKYDYVTIADLLADWLWRAARRDIINDLGTTREAFGTGMAPDKQTWRFMKAYVNEHNEFPSCVRHTMKTAQRFQDLPAYHPQ